MHGLNMIMQKNTKICMILPRIPYKQSDFDYLETFAAPLMGGRTRIWKLPSIIFSSTENLLEVNYEKHFEACKSSSCTYTHMSASSFAGVAAIITGLLGGINNATTATFKILYSVMRGVVVPKKFRHRRDRARRK